jgi:phosphoribosylaminoimidazole-succinocarboxamide synthase
MGGWCAFSRRGVRMQALTSVDLSGLEVFSDGKVRRVYDLGCRLLIIASDRISAFDCVLPSGIPDKGKILTGISGFWFRRLEPFCRHHMITDRVEEFPSELACHVEILRDRSMVVWKADRIDIECIVRGYLAGSAWKEYTERGTVAGQPLRSGLEKNARLDKPIFTPSTKAQDGHDINISIPEMRDLVGENVADQIMAMSIRIYTEASRIAGDRGITILDTKFEFGYLGDDVILIDEALTPDSSRFWVSERPGSAPMSVDKQFIRDYLEETGWDKNPPPPLLPGEVIAECRRRYLVLYEKLTGGRPQWLR